MAPLIRNRDNKWRQVTDTTPWPETLGTSWIGGWVGPTAGLVALEKITISRICGGSNPEPSSPQPSQYDDLAILASKRLNILNYNKILYDLEAETCSRKIKCSYDLEVPCRQFVLTGDAAFARSAKEHQAITAPNISPYRW